jgi:hypothetical protein
MPEYTISLITTPFRSILNTGNTSGSGQVEAHFDNLLPSANNNIMTRQLAKRPHSVTKGALEGFKTTLHDIAPELKNLTDKDLERLIEERNSDILDD